MKDADLDKRRRKFPDRRLGTSFLDWDGDIESHESDLNEGPGLYFSFLALELFLFTLLLGAISAFLGGTLSSVAPPFTRGIFYASAALAAAGGCAWAICFLAVFAKVRFLSSGWLARRLIAQHAILSRLGRPFGISRDRLGSSCVTITNALTRLRMGTDALRRPLILLPRCMTRASLLETRKIAQEWDCPVIQVPTNAKAREKVIEFGPSALIAVACERDLVPGLYDFGHKMPIIAVANKRPIGPCVGATMVMDELREALRDLHSAAGAARKPLKSAVEIPAGE